jgi:hypothetical protein
MCLDTVVGKRTAEHRNLLAKLKNCKGVAYRLVRRNVTDRNWCDPKTDWVPIYQAGSIRLRRWQKAENREIIYGYADAAGLTPRCYTAGFHVFWSVADAKRYYQDTLPGLQGREDTGIAEVRVRGSFTFGTQGHRHLPVIVASEQKLVRILFSNHKRRDRLSPVEAKK